MSYHKERYDRPQEPMNDTEQRGWEDFLDRTMMEELLNANLSLTTITRLTERIRTIEDKARAEEREVFNARLDLRRVTAHKGTCRECWACGWNAALDDLTRLSTKE